MTVGALNPKKPFGPFYFAVTFFGHLDLYISHLHFIGSG